MHSDGRSICAAWFVGLTMLGSALGTAWAGPIRPQYGFNARHDLFNPLEHTLNPSNVATLSHQWKFMTGNGAGIAPLGGPALADGVLYVAPYAQTTFIALDSRRGTLRWTYPGISTFSDP